MKKYNNLYNVDFKSVSEIYKTQIKVNTKNKQKIRKFEDYYSININDVLNIINDKNYIPTHYNIFLIREPKYRIVMSQNIKDKLINHVFGNLLVKVLEPSLINTNVATRKKKGTHYGIKYLKKYLNKLKNKKLYALKFDIFKYFYSIDHNILKEKLKTKIKDNDFLNILDKIIDSTNNNYINEKINFFDFKENF